ncbi:hypothetical protein AAFF_G00007130 [Aldrovandia affinis]|uniref:Uncharacterized protein n=1 Tax=Aldrovandia affinis TaxID=143900 RepID=A0AAD7T638_9TELE|nr:hypothetical protein AAFF_G00007130 [Aldrovandia affinis]
MGSSENRLSGSSASKRDRPANVYGIGPLRYRDEPSPRPADRHFRLPDSRAPQSGGERVKAVVTKGMQRPKQDLSQRECTKS